MNLVVWQLVALGILVLGIGLTGTLLIPKKSKRIKKEETRMLKKLYLVPLDEQSRGISDWLGAKLMGVFQLKVNSGLVAKMPEEAYNPSRDAYFSSVILNKLQFLKASEDEFLVAITDEDLFTPTTDFIYSSSDKLAGVAIVSTQRLKPEYYGLPQSIEVLRNRTLKKTIHEIGHILGLDNCDDSNCIMYSSKEVSDIDIQSDRFCQRCRVVLTIPSKVSKY